MDNTTVITIECWRPGCDFYELIEGIEGTTKTAYLSDMQYWSEHNRREHGSG